MLPAAEAANAIKVLPLIGRPIDSITIVHPDLERSARRDAMIAAIYSVLTSSLLLSLILFPRNSLLGVDPTVSAVLGVWAFCVSVSLGAVLGFPLNLIGDRIVAGLDGGFDPEPKLMNVTEEVGIAIGRAADRLILYDSDTANVGMFPTSDGDVVLISTKAAEILPRPELQALVAAQFAGLEDRWCALATRAEILQWATGGLALLSFPLALFGQIFTLVAVLAGAVVVFALPRWVEQARDLCADVAAVRTTYDPGALAKAMRSIAKGANKAHSITLGGHFTPTSPFLVLPKRIQSKTYVGESGNGGRQWTSSDEVRMELELRADRAEALASGANPQEITGLEFLRRWGKLGS